MFIVYSNIIIIVGLDFLIDSDKNFFLIILKDDLRMFYVSDFKYSCYIVLNIINLIGM